MKVIKDIEPTDKQNFIWNMIGSGVYSASSMLLSLFVINIVGAEEGGMFSIALTLSQMLVYIAYFEMRTYQITDSKNEFKFSEYHMAKIILCVIMLIVSLGYILIKNYNFEKSIIVMLVCFLRLLDGYADVYESHFQKIGRLDLAGKSLAYRTILFVLVLLVGLLLSGKLVISLVIADIIAIFGVWYYDIRRMQMFCKIEVSFDISKIVKIIRSCFPLFIGVFCWTYILSASRIAIDGNMTNKYQAYYQIIFMPVSVINPFAGFVLRPLLPRLSESFYTKKFHDFKMILTKVFLGMGVITLVCMIGGFLLGIPVLSMLSGCNLTPYKGILVFLLFAGGINAVGFTMYYILTIMRCMKSVLVDYIVVAIVAGIISGPLVRLDGIRGASISFFVTVVLLCILFGGSIFIESYKIHKSMACQ